MLFQKIFHRLFSLSYFEVAPALVSVVALEDAVPDELFVLRLLVLEKLAVVVVPVVELHAESPISNNAAIGKSMSLFIFTFSMPMSTPYYSLDIIWYKKGQ